MPEAMADADRVAGLFSRFAALRMLQDVAISL